MVRFVPYENIDKNKWDQCIRESENGLIYSTSSYLDSMAANWDALILDDYTAVMPLTWKKKYGIRYLYQPSFIQQNGIIGEKINEELISEFLEKAVTEFSFAEITLNFLNTVQSHLTDEIISRNNYILQLGSGIHENLKNYILKRFRRAEKNGLHYHVSYDTEHAVEFYKKLYQKRLPSFTDSDFENFTSLCKSAHLKVDIRNVHDQNNNVVALVLLLSDSKRIYNIISCITSEGKKQLANYFLYYKVIEEFSDTNLIFDFEGSDIPGIAYFYEKFADKNQMYPFIKINRLPAPLKIFKK